MLGCVSVAPPGMDQLRGTDLGVFGGNLDYNDNVEGTTLYFPVFHAGALFGIGDAHAAQGDGELTGSALETSADVEFTVDVIKGDIYQQVRAETKDFLIAFGVSGSVHESIQASTALLVDWLKRDYKMTDSEVALFVGAVMQYDIAELVDPHINVVAKVPKTALAHLKVGGGSPDDPPPVPLYRGAAVVLVVRFSAATAAATSASSFCAS